MAWEESRRNGWCNIDCLLVERIRMSASELSPRAADKGEMTRGLIRWMKISSQMTGGTSGAVGAGAVTPSPSTTGQTFSCNVQSWAIPLFWGISLIFVHLHAASKQSGPSQNRTCCLLSVHWGFYFSVPVAQMVKDLPAVQETQVRSFGQEAPPEKGMATCSSILAWRIPWSLVGYSPWASQSVRQDWATDTSLSRIPQSPINAFLRDHAC